MARENNHLHVLLVEDNPVDVLLTKESLKEWKIRNTIHVVEDGQDALDFIYGRVPYTGSPKPDLVLLDLNLPRKSGAEVLAEIQKDPELSNILVIVITTSNAHGDEETCHALGAKLYIIKPVGLEEYSRALNSVQDFWLQERTG